LKCIGQPVGAASRWAVLRVLLLAAIVLASGCGRLPAPETATPAETFEVTSDSQATAEAAMKWLVTAVPHHDPRRWELARDRALDFIEAQTDPRFAPTPAIVGPVQGDRHYKYGRHTAVAYRCGRATYLLAHPAADLVAVEVAGIRAMFTLFRALAVHDPRIRSPKLRRYWRKERRGKLEGLVRKRLAG
jgi:hypothetical protein